MEGHHHHHHESEKNIATAFFLNLGFAVIETIGGFFTNSIAILSDALHDFGDSLSLGVSWYLQKYSQKGRDNLYSYGYKRFSLLGALFTSTVLLFGSIFIIKECAERVMNPVEPKAYGMLGLAVLGVIINGAAVLRLHHGKSLNERAVTLHLLEDVFGWIAVLVVSIVMIFINLPILDPILSICISLWVLFNVYRNIRDTFKVLLQQAPEDVNRETLLSEIAKITNVKSAHDFHIWSLDGETHVVTMHIVTKDNITSWEQKIIKDQIRQLCKNNHIAHSTIEMETVSEGCFGKCELD